jgi:hypothetical protein
MGKPVSLAEAIGSFARENRISGKLAAAHVVNAFMSLLPESNRSAIQKADFSNGILRVTVGSPALRNDLQMATASIMDMINERMEADIVKKIILF